MNSIGCNITPLNKKRLEYVALTLKEMRLAEGKKQDSYLDEGLSRRQIQRAEYGYNISLAKLFLLLDCYGYTLKDLDWIQ